MAKAQGAIGDGLRGKIDGLSFYKMKGVEGTVVRRSAGHTKKKKDTDPKLRNFKLSGDDFAGRACMSKYLIGALTHQRPMADYNISGPLIALMKPVQELDGVSDFGVRNVRLTAYPHVIKGFSLNKNNTLDSVIRFPVTGTIDRETLSAKVQFPELVPGINFAPPVKQPYYAFRISLAVIPDVVFDQGRYAATHPAYHTNGVCSADSQWFSPQEGSQALDMEVNIVIPPPDNNFTLMLAAGIMYGEVKALDLIWQVKHAGSSKVLEVG